MLKKKKNNAQKKTMFKNNVLMSKTLKYNVTTLKTMF